MTEINFQCADCGVCFQDNEDGARLAKEHVKLTGHNEDLMTFDVQELLKNANTIIDKLSIVQPKKRFTELLNECETKVTEGSS